MKVIVFGAGGIIGQHLRLCVPAGVEAIYTRRQPDSLHIGLDMNDHARLSAFLDQHKPDAIINLAGENRPDVVERYPQASLHINVEVPAFLSLWAQEHEAHYVHVSSQAVFGGTVHGQENNPDFNPPYRSDSFRVPVNAYGSQKLAAEMNVQAQGSRWTIARPTFVIGVRPIPTMGRENPVEQMMAPSTVVAEGEAPAVQRHVNNRWFSVAMAEYVAHKLWWLAGDEPQCRAINIGIPYRVSRYDIARYLRADCEPIAHEDLDGFAPRPIDTTYAGAATWQEVQEELFKCVWDYQARETLRVEQRAKEIALFLGKSEDECQKRLLCGFGALHNEVAADFRRANPQTDDELLKWYRDTEAYIYELSAYHLDPGFNYSGMCCGIAEALKAKGCKRVLCLGDGIGDLTLTLRRAGFDAAYHDLYDSRTARFAAMRLWMYTGEAGSLDLTKGWKPDLLPWYDAIVSLDYMEHVTSVDEWARAIHAALKPGGWFCAQNAFAIGSGPDGSIPMHLQRNDKYEKEWDPMLFGLGFRQETSNWYQKA